ncbi:peptidylprolyl isomerase, partial [Klebsiella pneumoniae]
DAAKLAGAQISPQNGLPRSAITDAKIGTPAFSLKAGEVSAPIAMPQGFAVVKVVSITAAHVAPFEEKKGEIENALREIAAKRAVEKQVQ